MAANLGQAFLGAGIVPTLAQELAAGNFHESRETFHDYIYSKLILGEEKGNNPSVSSPNPPVFPNTNLASSYPNTLPIISSPYSQGSSSSSHIMVESGGSSISSAEGNKTFSASSLIKASSSQKSTNTKKKPQNPQNMIQQVSLESGGDLTKVKKKSHHKKKEKSNMCDVCGRGFAEKYTLNRHMSTHTHIKPYSCTKCNMSFSRSDGLAKHMAAGHRRIDAHHCDVCGGTFNSEVSFEQHRREYGNTLPFVCNLCMLAFSQCCHLNYHMKSHPLSKMNDSLVPDNPDDKNNTIDVSELIPDDFSPPKKDTTKSHSEHFLHLAKAGDLYSEKRNDSHSLSTLDPNVLIKPEIEDYPNCHAITSQMSRSNVQGQGLVISSFTALNNLPSVTSSSANPQDVTNSQGNHAGDNLPSISDVSPSYLPDTTGGLSSPTSSEATPISETEMKKYLDIKIPNPRFLDASLLHGANINEDGLFRCEICGKGFTRKYHMQRHVKLHVRGPIPKAHLLDWTRRPYACGVCKMGFTRQHHLTRHMLIHTGERPHSCHVCGKAFRRFTNLTLHVRTVHGAERPFKCQICGRGFPRLYSLQRHLKLHAKNAAVLKSNSTDQLYLGFKAAGTININQLESGKSPSCSSVNPGSIQQSPGHSRESVSSDHSDGSERFEQEPSTKKDGVGHIDTVENGSPITKQDKYALMQDRNHDTGLLYQSDLRSHNKDQNVTSLLCQADGRSGLPAFTRQQVIPTLDSASRVQSNRIVSSNNEGMIRQNSIIQTGDSNEFSPSPRPSSVALLQVTNATDFSQQSPMQNSSTERFITSNAMSTQNITATNLLVGRNNFNELDNRETKSYSLNHRADSGDAFVLHQQRIQSPHPLMTSLERPVSRSMMNPASVSDTYHQSQTSYIQSQASLLTQQRVSMDLSATRSTMSPASIRDPGGYSHNHHVDMGGNHGGINDPPAYSHNHNVSNMSFPDRAHGMYQQQLSDSLNHPNPSASPMPANSHSNNIQY